MPVIETETRTEGKRLRELEDPSIQFIFAVHNHQPVGNTDEVFVRAYERAYAPFLETLEFYPAFRACLHHSGALLLWIAEHRPEYIERLGILVERRQVELLGGAFYEPILPMIPERDRIGQLLAMSYWLEDVFGVRPRGAWLAERVWEPTLPQSLKAAGIEYTVLDDAHFLGGGVGENGCLGYWLTEDQGNAIAVFPIHSRLRHCIPSGDPAETISWLRQNTKDKYARTAVVADDGEKFGLWPESHWHCYEQGWMYRFAEQLSNNSDWLWLQTFSDVLDTTEPMGRVYLPAGSYPEMMEWALPPEVRKQRTNGGGHSSWRSFLSRYDEANHLHKKMLRVSAKLDDLPETVRNTPEYAEALDRMWRGQYNDPLWHGVFGGLYLPNLRGSAYSNLIAAETWADEKFHGGKPWCSVTAIDMDVDGHSEVIVDSRLQSVTLQPHRGGVVIEHDVRGAEVNILDTLMRRHEAYHDVIEGKSQGDLRVKGDVEIGMLSLDWYRRGSFIDHFIGTGTTPEEFRDSEHEELGDFVNAAYTCAWSSTNKGASVTMAREGLVSSGVSASLPVRIEKTIDVCARNVEMRARYRIINRGESELAAGFGIEFGVALLADHHDDVYHEVAGVDMPSRLLDSTGAVEKATSFRAVDGLRGLSIEWLLSKSATHWRLPVETVSNSEAGLERVHQSAVVMPVWDLKLAPGASWSVTIDYKVRILHPVPQ